MNNDRKGVALVTGASARIGRAVAMELAQQGFDVAVHARTSNDTAQATVQAIQSQGGQAGCFTADLAVEAQVDELARQVAEQMGLITCLVNNASTFEDDDIETMTRASWDAHIEPNLRAPLRLTQLMADALDRSEAGCETVSGNVINLIDQRVLKLTPQFMSYTLSKAALWTLTQTLAQGLAPRIRVNAIAPGPTLKNSRQSDEHFAKQVDATPLQRGPSLDEIRSTVAFILATPSLTGQMITLDGGQHLNWQTPDVTGIVE